MIVLRPAAGVRGQINELAFAPNGQALAAPLWAGASCSGLRSPTGHGPR